MFGSDGRSDMYKIVIIEENATKQIIGAGTIFTELKFVRDHGLCGHIEDIVVTKKLRGKSLGLRMIILLGKIGFVANKCYKVILDCEDKNVAFYEKCGYHRKGAEMA